MQYSILIGLIFLSANVCMDAMQGNPPKDRIPNKTPLKNQLPSSQPFIQVSPRKNSIEKKRPDAPLTGAEKTALLRTRNLK